jgi:hypothetical protein
MSRSGGNQTTEEIATKEAQERELKEAQTGDLTGRAPSRSNGESSDDSSSDSDSNSDSSDEDVKDDDDVARKVAKKRRKAKKKKKKAKKLLKKMINKDQAKYTHSSFHEVPHNYTQFSGNHPNKKFYSVHLGKPPHFDGKDYPKWAYDMQMHLYGLHPSLWKIVVVGVTIPAEGEALTLEHEQDLHSNMQAKRVITGSLCAQEFNKVWNIQIAKVIWDTLKEAHESTEHVRQGKMDLINGELELVFMKDGENVKEMYDRLMLLVSDIRALGSEDWDDSKVTKKLLRAFAPKDKNSAAMIRRGPNYYKMTPNQLLGEILHQELVDQDVEKSLSLKMNKSLALNASSSEVVEVKQKTSKTKKEDTSDEGSTYEETAFAIRKYKKFLKSRASRKGGDERKKKSQIKCYECGEYGHFIAECPKNKNKKEEEKKYKEKSKEYKNKYQGRAHVGQQWDSSDEDEEPKKHGMATIAMAQESYSQHLFNNFFDDEDHSHFCLMERGRKVQETTTSSSLNSSSSTPSDIDDLDDEKEIEANMVNQFSKKGYKEIKGLLEKLEKKKVSLHEQEDLLILEKERNLTLERCLAKEAAKVEKLTTDLSLANNSNKRMSKDYTLENESLASLKATHSELQSSFACLTEKHKILEANYSTLWESTKANPKAIFDSSVSTRKGCFICSNIDINALKTNHARLEETIKSKDKEIA